jgi:hypothetical protein
MAKKPGYCTGFRQAGGDTQTCCQKHDEAYALGVDRLIADKSLRRCLQHAGYPARAQCFYIAVRLVGWTRYYWLRIKERLNV